MKINSLTIANYFVDLANKEGKNLYLLGLIKRVYIAHGFSLALFDKSLLDERFDQVEAWKYGPVIPSVYHSFKHLKNDPITPKDKAVVLDSTSCESKEINFTIPKLTDQQTQDICYFVWKRYGGYDDWQLVELLHMDNTPWKLYYKEGENVLIPDVITREYYRLVLENIKKYELKE